MMISAPSSGDPYAAAAAVDRQLRAPAADAADASSDSDAPDASPDVVVTLSSGPSSAPATYNAAGRLAAKPTLDDLGANAPDSLAHATESVDDDASPAPTSDGSDATTDQDAAVPA